MESTEAIECTQELYYEEKPEQIGYLGICGQKHPLFRGANKIGKDPETCSIIINLNFISKQHALINIISRKELMLMDLDSIGKTMFLNKILKPYIPYRIKDGDVVQFGSIIGVIRLLEDDVQPITPAIDLTESSVTIEHVSEPEASTILVPESPNAGDKPSCSAKADKEKKQSTAEKEVPSDVIDGESGECNKKDTKTVPVPIKPKVLIPEKASSFSIHPGLCKDYCSYCSRKFGTYDQPRHLAYIKSSEKVKKILDNEKDLTADSCLCNACYRYVVQRNNYLTYRVSLPLSKHLARKSKKSNTNVQQSQKNDTEETQHDKLTKKLEPKPETRESKALDKADSEFSEKSKNNLEADTVKEGSKSEKQPRIDQNKILISKAKSNDPIDQSYNSEADTQTGPIQIEEQNDPPARDTIKKLKEVRKVKCSTQGSDSLGKTLEKRTRTVERPTITQNESSSKDIEDNTVKVDILKNILLNKASTTETIANKKPADIILFKNKWLVKESDNKNRVMERIAILKNITLNGECSLEVIPRKKVPDVPDKCQISKNTSLVEENLSEKSKDEELMKESSPIMNDTNVEDIAIVNNTHTEECTINTTPKKKMLRKRRMLKNKNEFIKGKQSIATNSDKIEDEKTKDIGNSVSSTEKCTVQKPYKLIVSKNKWLVKRNLNKRGSKIKFAKRKHSSLMKSDNNEDRVKKDIPKRFL